MNDRGEGAVVLDRAAIEALIPHRDPFLWLDEVVELTATTVRANKRLPEDLAVFEGHYPGFAVLPGVLLCEATAVHGGRHTQVWDAEVSSGGSGSRLALFRCTQMILWPKGPQN